MKYSKGYLLDNRYQLERFIGSGTFGEVWVAKDTATDLEIAIKVYVSMDEKGLEEFKKEFQISFELNHTNLLHANYLGVNPEDKRPFLVMPFCPDGSVSNSGGNISERDLWRFIRDVAAGLAYLHAQNPPIIHQDIKPDNILILKNGDFVITDFGISKQLRSTLRKSANTLNSAGAISYMGPERFSKQYHAVKASDIWSLGVSIFELATGELPFCGMGGSLLKQGADMPELPTEFTPTLNMVCQDCMTKEPWNRPTAAQLADFADKVLAGAEPKAAWRKGKEEPKAAVEEPQVVAPVESNPQPAANNMNKTVQMSTPAVEPEPKKKSKATPATATVAQGSAGVSPDVDPGEAKFVTPQQPGAELLGAWVWPVAILAGLLAGFLLHNLL